MKTKDESTFWDHLDGIVAINLDERTDRWEALQNQAAELAGQPLIERISAIRGANLPGFGKAPWFRGRTSTKRWGSRAGCTQSHRKVMEHAQSQDWQTFLILEDDADLTNINQENLANLCSALFEKNTEWDLCYLGFSKSVGTGFTIDTFSEFTLCEIFGCYTTHAYLIKQKARDWILSQLPATEDTWSWHARHGSIDRWYSRKLSSNLTVYGITPSLIPQKAGFSDIAQRSVDYNEEFSGFVSSSTKDRQTFKRRKKTKHIQQCAREFYDWIRARIKRYKGL